MALLDLVGRARRGLGIGATVVHLDHGWRAESAADAAFVAAAAAERGLTCLVERASGLAITEAAGRAARLSFFHRAAYQVGACAVLLGHSADDQCETVLMHLLRGAGSAGMIGMRARSIVSVDGGQIALLRPLLGFRRADLRGYCQRRRIVPRDDPSNDDDRFLRNRVRRTLLPAIEQIAPSAVEAVARLADVATAEADFLAELAASAVERVAKMLGPDRVEIDRAAFRAEPLALQRGVLRHVGGLLLGPASDLTLERVEAARQALVGHASGAVIEWPAHFELRVERQRGTLARRSGP
jgi:tRNA(Ile)-lysidine synthetase-like protein